MLGACSNMEDCRPKRTDAARSQFVHDAGD
jgi:hypothetical protein